MIRPKDISDTVHSGRRRPGVKFQLAHMTILLASGGALLLSGCESRESIQRTYLDSPGGFARLELKDWGDGKEVFLSDNTSKGERANPVLQFEICSNVSIGWLDKDHLVVLYDDIEATYFNTFVHGERNAVNVTLCDRTSGVCPIPRGRVIDVPGCYRGSG